MCQEDDTPSSYWSNFLKVSDLRPLSEVKKTFKVDNKAISKGPPFSASYFLASYFMQMRFEVIDLKFKLATLLFYIFIPGVTS